MLAMSDIDINRCIPLFSNLRIDVTFLVPTPTGYQKSIMDSTIPLRNFLVNNDLHNYEKQGQGQSNKVILPTFFVTTDNLIETTASLYRPETKDGDPRIWFLNLKKYCSPCNVLAIVTDSESLYVINLSDIAILEALENGGYPYQLLNHFSKQQNAIADELIEKIRDIHNRGFVQTVVTGDTGVGMTLENLIGIEPNASKLPDYKGIELKAARKKQSSPNRVNFFSQVPDWANSHGMTAVKLLAEYGYWATDKNGAPRFNLYCTVKANEPNSQGLYFDVDIDNDILINKSRIDNIDKYVLQWNLSTLRNRLAEKHKETFWIKAETKFEGEIEYFRYDIIIHTKKPNVSLVGYLLDSQVITMDYTMHKKPDGQIRDHGYIFKTKPSQVDLLFPAPIEILL